MVDLGFPVVLSAAKDLTRAARPVSGRSVRSFAALRMTRRDVGKILHVVLVRDAASLTFLGPGRHRVDQVGGLHVGREDDLDFAALHLADLRAHRHGVAVAFRRGNFTGPKAVMRLVAARALRTFAGSVPPAARIAST